MTTTNQTSNSIPAVVKRQFARIARYGSIRLSVQASAFHYCIPREADAPISAYSHVEVAIIKDGSRRWLLPSEIGLADLDQYWDDAGELSTYPVGQYVPQSAVRRLREALRREG